MINPEVLPFPAVLSYNILIFSTPFEAWLRFSIHMGDLCQGHIGKKPLVRRDQYIGETH